MRLDLFIKLKHQFILFPYFSQFSIMILSYTLILAISQFQTQQIMTSQIRSHIKYLIHIYYFLVLNLVKTNEKSSLTGGFDTI